VCGFGYWVRALLILNFAERCFVDDLEFINDLFVGRRREDLSVWCMRRSKLELYEAVLGALVRKPLTIDRLAFETSMDCGALRQRLEFLVRNELIEERDFSGKMVFALTERGVTVFKTLSFQKYFEKVANTIRMVDEALQVLPSLSSGVAREKSRKTEE